MALNQLTFFCELATPELQSLFNTPELINDLQELNAGLSLGILDLSGPRAEIVRRLNQANIPVTAWLLLPESEGYWFNLDNVVQASKRYLKFKAWTQKYELQWARIGLDIEPDIREMKAILSGRWQLLPMMIKRALNTKRLYQAQEAYQTLVKQIQTDGYLVDSYLIPFIMDERLVGATLMQRLTGLVNIECDRDILMLYSSFMGPFGAAIVWSYGQQAQAVALGNTGGGVDVGNIRQLPPLSWEALSRDLCLSHQWHEHIHIFCLEGCVKRGFLEKLKTFDWKQETISAVPLAREVNWIRFGMQTFLKFSKYPFLVLGIILGGMLILFIGVTQLGQKTHPE